MRYLEYPFDATSMTTPGVVAAAAAAAMVAVMQGQRVKETKKERSRTFNLKVYGSFESKVRASSRRWELRVEGGTFESKVGPQGWVQFTPRATTAGRNLSGRGPWARRRDHGFSRPNRRRCDPGWPAATSLRYPLSCWGKRVRPSAQVSLYNKIQSIPFFFRLQFGRLLLCIGLRWPCGAWRVPWTVGVENLGG